MTYHLLCPERQLEDVEIDVIPVDRRDVAVPSRMGGTD